MTSPYARKVRMLISELGLRSQIENVVVNPFDLGSGLEKITPLGKVPALVIKKEDSIYDSPLICRYLIDLASNDSMVPYQKKWNIYRWEALADGMTDASYNLVMELMRPKSEQSAKWIDKWTEDIKTALIYMNHTIKKLPAEVTLAHLAIASAVGYLDFRLSEILHEKEFNQARYKNLLKWYKDFSKRESMKATVPH